MSTITKFCRYCFEKIQSEGTLKQSCSPACRANYSTLQKNISSGRIAPTKTALLMDASLYGSLDPSVEGHLHKYHYTIIRELNECYLALKKLSERKSFCLDTITQDKKKVGEFEQQIKDIDQSLQNLQGSELAKTANNLINHQRNNPDFSIDSLKILNDMFKGFAEDYSKKDTKEKQRQNLQHEKGVKIKERKELILKHNELCEEYDDLKKEIEDKKTFIQTTIEKLNRGDLSGLQVSPPVKPSTAKMTDTPTPQVAVPKDTSTNQGRISSTSSAPLSPPLSTLPNQVINNRENFGQISPTKSVEPSLEGNTDPEELLFKKVAKGEGAIFLGKITEGKYKGYKVYYNPLLKEPVKLSSGHLLIIGMSGSGKSETIAAILYELFKKAIPFLILDLDGAFLSEKHKNAAGIPFQPLTRALAIDANEGIAFNPLEPGIDPLSGKRNSYMKVVYGFAALIDRIFALGPIQESALRNALKEAFESKGWVDKDKSTYQNPAPTMEELWQILNSKGKSSTYSSLTSRIESLFDTSLFKTGERQTTLENMLEKNTIINLSTLPTAGLRTALCQMLLLHIYRYMLSYGPTEAIRQVIVIDEAHKLKADETLTELFREARKYGIVIMLASHSAKDFDPIVLDMVGTKIIMQLDGDSAKEMARHMGEIDKGEIELIRKQIIGLIPGGALLRSNHYRPWVKVILEPLYAKQ